MKTRMVDWDEMGEAMTEMETVCWLARGRGCRLRHKTLAHLHS